jgi:serine/threonine-protein kinase
MTPSARPKHSDGEATQFMPRTSPESEFDEGTIVLPASSPLRSQLSRSMPQMPPAPPLKPLPPLPSQPSGAAPDAEATQVRPRATVRTPTTPAADPDFGRPSTFSSSNLPGHTIGSAEATAPIIGEAPMRQVGPLPDSVAPRSRRHGHRLQGPRSPDQSVGGHQVPARVTGGGREFHARFLREARAAGGLSHPNIVVVHDVGEIEGRPYMAMELVDGVPLADQLDKGHQFPIRDAVVIGLQLARALDYAHAHGIVHRDIKPGNILMLSDAKTVKVTDFGIAHMDDAGQQHTQVGAVMGTPQYMSPEQTRGEKLDGRSDLFSAGIVLYQMVTGERPFKGETLVAVATRIANEAPPTLTSKRPDAPASLRRVIERCLAKQPAQRYQSGKDLSDALVKVLNELDEAVRENSKARIVPLRVKWAIAMAGVVAIVMGITATSSRSGSTTH